MPDRELWAQLIAVRVRDAMGSFRIPDEANPSLEKQYQALRKKFLTGKKKKPFMRCDLYNEKTAEPLSCSRGRQWLETSQFDEVAQLVGYESEFVKRTFNLVQEAIAYEKKLWDEFKGGR